MIKQLLNNLEIKKAERYMSKCRKHHLTSPCMAVFDCKVEDINGDIKSKYRQLSHSYTRNFHNFLLQNALIIPSGSNTAYPSFGEGNIRLRDVNAVIVSLAATAFCWNNVSTSAGNVNLAFVSGAGNATYGVVVGTGNTAENLNDYILESKIGEGIGVGQLNHQIMVRDNLIYNPLTDTFSIDFTRAFHNNSGATITIRELGIYVRASVVATQYIYCMIRDVLPTPIEVPTGQKVTITYRFSYTLPE